MRGKIFFLSVAVFIFFCSFSDHPKNFVSDTIPQSSSFVHPRWAEQSNIYEVNIRQYSPEGTFKAFEKSLPRLKKMGVKILWFMPITPIGLEDRKENSSQLGSYYAVKNYRQINPEFGTMTDWVRLVKHAHTLGFKVITDWVANHTAPDNPWMKNHPDFYSRDANGKVISPFDWTDTRKLNYENSELRDSMIAVMKYWLVSSNIDGFRCDVADGPPLDFWKECITELKKIKNVFMLAESETAALHQVGFDETYAWSVMPAMHDVYVGKKSLQSFDSLLNHNLLVFPRDAYRLFFTTNHDENSWNGTEFEKYGDSYKAWAVFTQTMYQSVPLIYSGQEAPNKKRLKFFVKDSIAWDDYSMAPFYSALLHLRSRNPALAAASDYQRISTANDEAIFAYVRKKGNHLVLVVLNLSPQPQNFTIKKSEVYGKAINIFTKQKVKLSMNHVYSMQPWDYLVYEF